MNKFIISFFQDEYKIAHDQIDLKLFSINNYRAKNKKNFKID